MYTYVLLQNPCSMGEVSQDFIDNIPGKESERKSPRGELSWIFTTITDTIAWNTLPLPTFQKLFRQDLLVASLFRFLFFLFPYINIIFPYADFLIIFGFVTTSVFVFLVLLLFLCCVCDEFHFFLFFLSISYSHFLLVNSL